MIRGVICWVPGTPVPVAPTRVTYELTLPLIPRYIPPPAAVPVSLDGFASAFEPADESSEMCRTQPAAFEAVANAVGISRSTISNSSGDALEGLPTPMVTKQALTEASSRRGLEHGKHGDEELHARGEVDATVRRVHHEIMSWKNEFR